MTDSGVLAGDERMLIDGELRPAARGAFFDVEHPATEQVIGRAADGTVADMESAVGAATRAFQRTDWARDVEFRYHCLTQLAAALDRNKEPLRRILVTEVGCPIMQEPLRDRQFVRRHRAEWARLPQRGTRISGVLGHQDDWTSGVAI